MRPHRNRLIPAFTLIEMLMAISILALLVAVVLPRFTDDDRLRVRAASSLIVSDLEYAQILSIASPNDPVMVKFDPANKRYWIARAAAPNDAITRPDTGEAYLVVLGVGRAAAAEGVAFEINGMTDGAITFNAQGGLVDFSSAPIITLTSGESSIAITVAATTGTIREQ